ncbi:hypothetical protein [Endozoicomonas sp. ONNA2]|uniref:hypothetical protein n=1 Tax=Endozoicomonas sp. ONNA2 TaxID=2828741 RepID=UPI002149061D|nr:hypothetical protein [Endozoicomonas sp. ONNA2]
MITSPSMTLGGPPKFDEPMPELASVYPHPGNLITDPEKRNQLICPCPDPIRHILNNPQQLSCGHLACKQCALANVKDINDRKIIICPVAGCNPHTKLEDMFPDILHRREVDDAVVHCLAPECGWRGRFKNYKSAHKLNCRSTEAYLLEENNYLKARYAHNTGILHGEARESKALRTHVVTMMDEIERLQKEISSLNLNVEMLNNSLAHAENENASLSAVIATLCNDQQSAQPSGFINQTPNTVAQAITRNPKLDNTTKVVPMAAAQTSASAMSQRSASAISQTSATGSTEQIVHSWKFSHATNLDKPGILQSSEPFTYNNYTFQLSLVRNSDYLGLYVRVIGADKVDKDMWPCKESMTFKMKDLKKNQHIEKTIHLSRVPDECRGFPGKTPLPLAGFEKFCPLNLLKPPNREGQPCFLDAKSRTTIEVVPAAQIKPDVIDSPYSVIGGSGLISWPIRNYPQRRKSHHYTEYAIESPIFNTSPEKTGYRFKLILNTHGTYESNHTRAGIYAQLMPGNHDAKLNWPVSGKIHVSLVDRRPSIANQNTSDLPEDASTIITVKSLNKVPRNARSYVCGTRTNETNFFEIMGLEEDQNDLSHPIFRHNKEIAIRAFFIPSDR